ncbi:zinc-dependent alcohol dehydrogenase family protein [Planktotalea arctica]|uniref:zinc-dependent alcohol dehydrogenase family protein n=1 Tax=Planktotalea arctica TaxID=1481893 RepID=UPI000A16CD3C|nr:zinc-dependent alcohol dehydrogenase family protein [Planktotalea arctica]
MSEMVKQVVYSEFGDPTEVLRLEEVPRETLEAGQARADVLRSPINPSDLIQISGNYGVRPPLPAIAGNEGIGRITEVSGDARGLAVGQLVLLPAGIGIWRSEVVASAGAFIAMPEGDIDQLSMMMVNPATAQLLLTDFVTLAQGDWVIQSAANSAVGTYVVQLAKAMGVKTVCVVRRESAVQGLLDQGADVVLVDGPDLVKRVKQATGGAKMKLGLDAVAGETFGRLGESLEVGGTLVNYGAMSNEPASMQAGAMIFRNVHVRGFWLVNWFERASKEERMGVYAALTKAVAMGTLYAPIDRHFSLEEISEAARYTWAGERAGKVLLAPNGI